MPKLTEDEIIAVIPIMKTEIAGYENYDRASRVDFDKRRELFNDIKSGKVDPLEWLSKRSKFTVVPPGAIYQPACSRSLSIKGWDLDPETTGAALPTAFFTFGMNVKAVNIHLLGKNITDESFLRFTENPYAVGGSEIKDMRAVLEKSRTFYSQRGFSADYSMGGNAVEFYPADAPGELSGTVWMVKTDLYDPAFPDVVKNCTSLPPGPSLEIRAGTALMEKFSGADARQSDAGNGEVQAMLVKAGMTDDRYGLVKTALIIARMGSNNPEEQELPAADFTPTTQEEKDAALVAGAIQADIKTRNANVRLYKKHKTELDPILDKLKTTGGGQ